jgi:hypothetical protein
MVMPFLGCLLAAAAGPSASFLTRWDGVMEVVTSDTEDPSPSTLSSLTTCMLPSFR